MTGFTNFTRNLLADFYMRDQAMTPPANFYIQLVSSAPTAASPGTVIAIDREVMPADMTTWSGTQLGGSTVASNGTTGTIVNNIECDLGLSPVAGTASHWEAYDAATGGNRCFWGVITDGAGTPTPRSIAIGDPVVFPIGALQVQWA